MRAVDPRPSEGKPPGSRRSVTRICNGTSHRISCTGTRAIVGHCVEVLGASGAGIDAIKSPAIAESRHSKRPLRSLPGSRSLQGSP